MNSLHFEKQAIPKRSLKDGEYYFGVCRNACVARWDAGRGQFVYWRRKFGHDFTEAILHVEDRNRTPFDLFAPLYQIDNVQCIREIPDVEMEKVGVFPREEVVVGGDSGS